MYELNRAGERCVRPRRTRGFWRRQFDDAPTTAQRRFDLTFGIVMPAVCFYFDPIVFRSGFEYGGGLYPRWQPYAYTISALEMLALGAYLFAARRGESCPAALVGMLTAGGAFALVVGLSILPYSVVGLIFLLVGALGFVPFVTAFVFLRNAWRASAPLGRADEPAKAAAAFALGFVLALTAPVVAQVSLAGKAPVAGEQSLDD